MKGPPSMKQNRATTLLDVLDNAQTKDDKGYTFVDDRLKPKTLSFAEIAHEATRRSHYFRSLGLKRGDRLALIVPEGRDFVLAFYGAIRAGIIPVPMYPPLALGRLDAYIDSAKKILQTSGAKMLLTSPEVAPVLWSLVSDVQSLETLVLTDRVSTESERASTNPNDEDMRPEDPCFLQFTSGSTSNPKGVVVTHRSLVANAKAIMFDGLQSNPERDRGVSWLPLYHDMGLIGFAIAPFLAEVPVVFLPTTSFVKRPSVWMETVSKYKGTITFAPNFAYGLAAKRAPQNSAGLDLSSLRVLGCGAEPINPKTLDRFVDVFRPHGLDPKAIMPCYGMAEATLAISFSKVDEHYETIAIDRELYESDHVAQPTTNEDPSEALELVSCGTTFADHEVGIMREDGSLANEGEVGEIVFQGPSLSQGYFENSRATKSLFKYGWLHTGDLGFMLDAKVFVSGRKKDLIILNGRNYYPQSIEWAVEQISGIRPGNVVAFAVRGHNTEELVIAAESKQKDHAALIDKVRQHLRSTLGLSASKIVILPAGALPKTSSGKLKRQDTKSRYEKGILEDNKSRSVRGSANRLMLARHLSLSALARLKHAVTKPNSETSLRPKREKEARSPGRAESR